MRMPQWKTRHVLLAMFGVLWLAYGIFGDRTVSPSNSQPAKTETKAEGHINLAASMLVYAQNCPVEAGQASQQTQALWISVTGQAYQKYGRDAVMEAAAKEYRETYYVQGRDYCRWMAPVMNNPPRS